MPLKPGFRTPMTALITVIFLASLLGSLHCVGMCGAFMTVVMGGERDASRLAPQIGYHGGRMITYVTLGAIAGLLGRAVDIAGMMAGLQPIAMTLSALVIIAFGAISWMRLKGVQLSGLHAPKILSRLAAPGYRFAMTRPPMTRAAIVGLLTTLLPCGWLWTFLVTAAGTAHPAKAAVAMSVFWLGTLPAMVTLGAGIRGVFGAAQKRVPTLACLAMIGVGLFTLAGRLALDPSSWTATPTAAAAALDVAHTKAPCCEVNDDHDDEKNAD